MKPKETKRFEILYDRHLQKLKLQGKSDATISAYSRAVRRLTEHFDCCPDQLTIEQLEDYFTRLIDNYSWSTVKLDRLGLMFFWKHVLEQDWQWLNIVKPPTVKTIPDILTPKEVSLLINTTHQLRYRVFFFATYSMGLRLRETISLQVSDIDTGRQRVHVRRGKGHKDRLVPLPERTLKALRLLWQEHRHPTLLFPNYRGSAETIIQAQNHMNVGSVQQAMKMVVAACHIKKKSHCIPSGTVSPLISWRLA
jgi:integrase/recombinase XerD